MIGAFILLMILLTEIFNNLITYCVFNWNTILCFGYYVDNFTNIDFLFKLLCTISMRVCLFYLLNQEITYRILFFLHIFLVNLSDL